MDRRRKHDTAFRDVDELITDSLPIARISYNSPLEVAFWVAGGGATGIAFRFFKMSTKAIALFERYQEARLKKSEVDMKVLRNEVLSSELKHIRELQRDARKAQQSGPEIDDMYLSALASRTMSALEQIDNIDIGN